MNDGYGVGILGMGTSLPERVVTNAEIHAWSGADPEEIVRKVGIRERRMADDATEASEMAAEAGRDALQSAGVDASALGLILGCNYSGDYHFPAMACKVQAKLKAWNAGAYDLLANCTSFQVGLAHAAEKMYFDAGLEHALVIGTALQSRYIDWHDPDTSMYCGDGAGAAVLGKVPEGYGVLSSDVMANGRVFEAARLRGGGSSAIITRENAEDGRQFFEMNGMEVWKQVIQWQPRVIKRSLQKIGRSIGDVDFFIFHQANLNLVQYLMGKMKVAPEKTYTTVETLGNTADASLPITLAEAVRHGKIHRGDLVVISGVGAGFIFGSTVMRWY